MRNRVISDGWHHVGNLIFFGRGDLTFFISKEGVNINGLALSDKSNNSLECLFKQGIEV